MFWWEEWKHQIDRQQVAVMDDWKGKTAVKEYGKFQTGWWAVAMVNRAGNTAVEDCWRKVFDNRSCRGRLRRPGRRNFPNLKGYSLRRRIRWNYQPRKVSVDFVDCFSYWKTMKDDVNGTTCCSAASDWQAQLSAWSFRRKGRCWDGKKDWNVAPLQQNRRWCRQCPSAGDDVYRMCWRPANNPVPAWLRRRPIRWVSLSCCSSIIIFSMNSLTSMSRRSSCHLLFLFSVDEK